MFLSRVGTTQSTQSEGEEIRHSQIFLGQGDLLLLPHGSGGDHRNSGDAHRRPAMHLVEITREQYEQMKRDLEQH